MARRRTVFCGVDSRSSSVAPPSGRGERLRLDISMAANVVQRTKHWSLLEVGSDVAFETVYLVGPVV